MGHIHDTHSSFSYVMLMALCTKTEQKGCQEMFIYSNKQLLYQWYQTMALQVDAAHHPYLGVYFLVYKRCLWVGRHAELY